MLFGSLRISPHEPTYTLLMLLTVINRAAIKSLNLLLLELKPDLASFCVTTPCLSLIVKCHENLSLLILLRLQIMIEILLKLMGHDLLHVIGGKGGAPEGLCQVVRGIVRARLEVFV